MLRRFIMCIRRMSWNNRAVDRRCVWYAVWVSVSAVWASIVKSSLSAAVSSSYLSHALAARQDSTPHQSNRSRGWACLDGRGQLTDWHLAIGAVLSATCGAIKTETTRRPIWHLLTAAAAAGVEVIRVSICRDVVISRYCLSHQLAASPSAASQRLLLRGDVIVCF